MENQNPPFPPPPPQGNPYQQNPYQQNPMGGNPMGMQQDLPSHIGVLVLGICSIVFCWCYGIIGLACGIIALVLGNKAMKMYSDNPGIYSEKSYKNAKAGRICAIIGTCLSIGYVIFIVCYIIFVGTMISSMPWQSMGRY
jgi:hypothetical protein